MKCGLTKRECPYAELTDSNDAFKYRCTSGMVSICFSLGEPYWEQVYNPGPMGIGEAIDAIRHGLRASRKGWNGKGQYLELVKDPSYTNARGEVVNADHATMGKAAIAFVGTSGVQIGWLASQADLLSEDWYIVE